MKWWKGSESLVAGALVGRDSNRDSECFQKKSTINYAKNNDNDNYSKTFLRTEMI